MLTIRPALQSDTEEQITRLEIAIEQLQKENVANKTAADVMTKRVAELESTLEDAVRMNEVLAPLTEFITSFKSRDEMQSFLDLFKRSSVIRFPEHKLRLVLEKLDDREDKWVMILEIFQEVWDKMTEQTIERVLKHLKEKDGM